MFVLNIVKVNACISFIELFQCYLSFRSTQHITLPVFWGFIHSLFIVFILTSKITHMKLQCFRTIIA